MSDFERDIDDLYYDLETIEDALSCDIEYFFSESAINKSQKYLLGQRITDFQHTDGTMVQAFVRGGVNYFVTLSVFDGELFSTCTCSENGRCEHKAALFQFARNKLIGSNVINIKNFEDECLEFFKMFKQDINNKNVITYETFYLLEDAVQKHLKHLNSLKDNEYVYYLIKLYYSVEKYNNNAFLSPRFKNLEKKFYNINYQIIADNIPIIKNAIKYLPVYIIQDFVLIIVGGYVNYLNTTSSINFQYANNIKLLVEFIFQLADTVLMDSDGCRRLEDYIDVINYYLGDDKTIKKVEQNLNKLDYLYAYSAILFIDKNYKKVIELYKNLIDRAENVSIDKLSFEYLFQVIKACKLLEDTEFIKKIILEEVTKVISEVTEFNRLISEIEFDPLFKAEFSITLKKKVNLIIDKLAKQNDSFKLYTMALHELDYVYEVTKDKYGYDLLMNYHYHISNMIEKVSQYDYSAGRTIINYLNKIEKLPLGKYFLFDLYDYARKLRKDNLSSDIMRNIRYINY